jgi:hypothetical protein
MITFGLLLTEEEAESTRRKNLERKKLRCLGCGREMMTDRCHRFCRVCQRRNRRNRYHLPKMGRIRAIADIGPL